MAEEVDLQEAWARAGRIAALYGNVPTQLTSVIRLLLADERDGRKDWSPTSLSAASRLFRGPSLCSVLYYSCQSFRRDQLSTFERVTPSDLVKLYTPLELVAIIAMIFLFRRARKVCPSEEFGNLSDDMILRSEMGFHVGEAIPGIGAALGMLRGGIRSFAFAALATQNLKLFRTYRRQLRTDDREFDAAFEIQEWGCTTAEIAAVLLQAVGLGVPMPNSIDRSLSRPIGQLDESAPDLYCASLAALWIECLLKSGEEPKITHRGDFYPFQDAKQRLFARANELRTRGSTGSWLTRGKDDIAAATKPALVETTETTTAEAEQELDDE